MTSPLHVGPPVHGGIAFSFTDVWICAAFAPLTVCVMYEIRMAPVAASTITVPWPVAGLVDAGTSCVLSSDTALARTPPCTLIWPRISPAAQLGAGGQRLLAL